VYQPRPGTSSYTDLVLVPAYQVVLTWYQLIYWSCPGTSLPSCIDLVPAHIPVLSWYQLTKLYCPGTSSYTGLVLVPAYQVVLTWYQLVKLWLLTHTLLVLSILSLLYLMSDYVIFCAYLWLLDMSLQVNLWCVMFIYVVVHICGQLLPDVEQLHELQRHGRNLHSHV